MDFGYWDQLSEPEKFLESDWENPSRTWAGEKIVAAVKFCGVRTMVEVGPGNGVDYARQFRDLVLGRQLVYTGWEGSVVLCKILRARHLESSWENQPLLSLPQKTFDLVYARHVLEHQPSLEPSLSHLLTSAKRTVVIVWYRPPSTQTEHAVGVGGEHYQTYLRSDALQSIAQDGWVITEEVTLLGDGNLGWVLQRS